MNNSTFGLCLLETKASKSHTSYKPASILSCHHYWGMLGKIMGINRIEIVLQFFPGRFKNNSSASHNNISNERGKNTNTHWNHNNM